MNNPVGKAEYLGELRMREALEAIKAHRDARDGGAPGDEMKRLRLLADDLYEAVVEYRLRLSGGREGPSSDSPEHH